MRAEKAFHIEPCFWLFAGTNSVDEKKMNKPDKKEEQKWSDFKNRLTLPNIDLSKTRGLIKRLESVYVGTSILVSSFPDVRWITEKVLFLFWLLGGIEDLRMRQLVQFIRYFHDIQRGRVTSSNVPKERIEMLKENWSKSPDDDGWTYADTHKIIPGVLSQQAGNMGRWELLPEGEQVKIEL